MNRNAPKYNQNRRTDHTSLKKVFKMLRLGNDHRKVELFLVRCYVLLLNILLGLITILTWPIILMLQQHSVTREWYYSHIFGFLTKLFNRFIREPKQKLFDSMNLKKLSRPKYGTALKVLEIGPGEGDNFKYYKSAIQLTTIDQNPFLKEIAQKLSAEYPLVNIIDFQLGNAEKMTCFEDNSFDIVCGTLIMCCINDNKAALSEIHRILKPNGRFYYLEGNRMQPNRFILNRIIQASYGWLWSICEYGCKFMHNDFDEKLKSSKLVIEWNEIYRVRECPIGHEIHYGCAVKK